MSNAPVILNVVYKTANLSIKQFQPWIIAVLVAMALIWQNHVAPILTNVTKGVVPVTK